MNEKLLKERFNGLKEEEQKTVMEAVAQAYGCDFEGMTTFCKWGVQTKTGVFSKDNRRFVFVAGECATLGWEDFAEGLDEESRADLEQALKSFGVCDVREFLSQCTTGVRQKNIAPMLVQCEPEPVMGTRTYSQLKTWLAVNGYSLPTADEWEYLCGGGTRFLFPWGDSFPYGMRLKYYEDDTQRERMSSLGEYPMETPNFLGVVIGYDPCKAELVHDIMKAVKGGDGGSSIESTGSAFLGYLPCSPYFSLDYGMGEQEALISSKEVFRRIIRIDKEIEAAYELNCTDWKSNPALDVLSDEEYFANLCANVYDDIYQLMAEKKYLEAIGLLDTKIKNTPDVAGLYIVRAKAYQLLGNPLKVNQDISRAIELEPDDIMLRRTRIGFGATSKQRKERNIADITHLLQIDADNQYYYYIRRAWEYRRLENFEEAIADIARVPKEVRLKVCDGAYLIKVLREAGCDLSRLDEQDFVQEKEKQDEEKTRAQRELEQVRREAQEREQQAKQTQLEKEKVLRQQEEKERRRIELEEKLGPRMAKIKYICDAMKERTGVDALQVKIDTTQFPTLFGSKFGGTPYWDTDKEYPCAASGQRLLLLAQFNLDKINEEGLNAGGRLPKSGMLQFFIEDSEVYGMDFEDATSQKNFRVVYHPVIRYDILKTDMEFFNELSETAGNTAGADSTPLSGEYAVRLEVKRAFMGTSDYRFNQIFTQIANEYGFVFENPDSGVNSLSDEEWQFIDDEMKSEGHWLLGYPFFTQADPRREQKYEWFDVLLFQMDSDYEGETYRILWGDVGVGNFFINSGALEEGDFGRILYNWDCC